tara:strand:- start:1269 stop:1730 length:462 start_codon:yes stop_codon:yes gene_type:complete
LNKLLFYFLYVSVLFFLISCSEQKSKSRVSNEREAIYQPSEMAITMRQMVLDMESVKHKLKAGTIDVKDLNHIIFAHSSIATDEPTDIEEIQPSFEIFSQTYIEQLEELKQIIRINGEISDQILLFNSALTTCISCHTDHCPGPISKIKKLKI